MSLWGYSSKRGQDKKETQALKGKAQAAAQVPPSLPNPSARPREKPATQFLKLPLVYQSASIVCCVCIGFLHRYLNMLKLLNLNSTQNFKAIVRQPPD